MGWKKGTAVMEAMPFAHVVMQKFREERCNFCLASCATLEKCSACKMSWYCSRPCQEGDWKLHKTECPMMKYISTLSDLWRLFLRLVIRVLTGDMERKLEESAKPCLRTFKDLESYDVRQNTERYEVFKEFMLHLRIYTQGFMQLPSEDVLLDIYGKIMLNLFSIYNESMENFALAMYNSLSLIDHACVPNAIFSFDGRKMIFRVVTDMDSESYQDLRINYIEVLDTTAERQAKLQEQYKFTCTCRNCTSPELDRIKLSIEGGTQGDVDRVKECLDKVDHMLESQEDPSSILSTCEQCLSTVSHLPITNIYVVRLTGAAFDAALLTENYEKAVRLGLKNLKAYKVLLPHYNPRVGNLYASLGRTLVKLDRHPEALINFNKALEIFSVIFGEQHPIFHDVTKVKCQCEMELKRNNPHLM